jgi:uncharacterized protein (TIGR02117 family)
VLVGWGHRDFYLDTPTWEDLTLKTAVRAVLGIGGTAMHITYSSFWFDPESSVILFLSPADYLKLVDRIAATVVSDTNGRAIPLAAPGYAETDAFYEPKGSYNALYTCNNWAASILAGAGVRVPLWSPFSDAVMDQIRAAIAD